jgi:hypothetical protein
MIWASSDKSRLAQHNIFGSYSPDLRPLVAAAAGDAARAAALSAAVPPLPAASDEDAAVARAQRARWAHGALMLAAFVLLMPTGILTSRHKWLFGDKDAGKIKGHWYHAHIYIQSLAIVLAIASTILIFAVFGRNRQRVSDLYTPHMGLGLFAVAAAFIQGFIGRFRCERRAAACACSGVVCVIGGVAGGVWVSPSLAFLWLHGRSWACRCPALTRQLCLPRWRNPAGRSSPIPSAPHGVSCTMAGDGSSSSRVSLPCSGRHLRAHKQPRLPLPHAHKCALASFPTGSASHLAAPHTHPNTHIHTKHTHTHTSRVTHKSKTHITHTSKMHTHTQHT